MKRLLVKRWLLLLVTLLLSMLIGTGPRYEARAQSDEYAWMEDVLRKTIGELGWSTEVKPWISGIEGATLRTALDVGGVPSAFVLSRVAGTDGFMMILDPERCKSSDCCTSQDWLGATGRQCLIELWIGDSGAMLCERGLTDTKMHEFTALEGACIVSGYGTNRELRWFDGTYVYIVIQSAHPDGTDEDWDGLSEPLAPPCEGDRCIGEFGTHVDQEGNPTGCPDRDRDGLVDHLPDPVPPSEPGFAFKCPPLEADTTVNVPPLGGEGPHWEWGEVLYYYATTTARGDETYNLDPEITDFSIAPEKPSSADKVVITVEASDPDGDSLFYSWWVNGERQSAESARVTWRNPPAGYHDVIVQVSDGKGGIAEEQVRFQVTSHVGAGDRDGDGVPDDEDLCPEEAGLEPDGCPEFAVRLGCEPSAPTAGEKVVCSAEVRGAQEGETFEYHWYLDSAFVESTEDPSWTWGEAKLGTHDILIQVVGENRWAEADATLEIGAELDLAARIGMTPDPPVENKTVIFTVGVEGLSPDEISHYNWFLDGELICEDEVAICALSEPMMGSHTVQVDVHADDGRVVTDIRTFATVAGVGAVADAGDAAGFSIDLACPRDTSSDETLECTVTFVRIQQGIGVLDVVWLIDGATAATESTVRESTSWALEQPAPGDHTVEVRATDPQTGLTRVTSAPALVRPGRNAMVPPAAQAGAAAGTVSAVGAWLWLEWLLQRRAQAAAEAAAKAEDRYWAQRKRRDRQEAQRRHDQFSAQQWKKYTDRSQQDAEQQKALADEWRKLYDGLLEASEHGEGLDDLLDFVDRHYQDVCKDGVWDRVQMDRLQEAVRRLGTLQFDRDLYKARNQFLDTVSPDLQAIFGLSKSFVFRVGTDVLTAGLSEFFWTPVSSLEATWQAALKGKGADDAAWEGYKQAAKDVASMVLWDRVITGAAKAFAQELEQLGSWASQRAAQIDDSVRNALNRWRGRPPELPTIRHDWGKPVTYLDRPTPFVDRLNRLRNLGLEDDVGRLMSQAAGGLDMQPVGMLLRGQRAALTPDEQIARRLLNNPRYRQALDQGLIPRQVHDAVNHVRDKLAKNAVHSAYESLPDEIRRRIARIEFTGTGARPHSPAATSGWTDLDMTVRADPNAGDLAQEAEAIFADSFRRDLRAAGLDPDLADVNMFEGLRAQPTAPPRGGYSSPELIHWQETDVTFRARCAVPTKKGSMMFNAHPDVRPVPGQVPYVDPVQRAIQRSQFDPARAAADVRRVILEHVDEMPEHLGRQPNQLDILRAEGKHARRVWWVQNAGTGQDAPSWMRTLDRMKSDRTWTPSPAETEEAWEGLIGFLGLPEDLGGIQ